MIKILLKKPIIVVTELLEFGILLDFDDIYIRMGPAEFEANDSFKGHIINNITVIPRSTVKKYVMVNRIDFEKK